MNLSKIGTSEAIFLILVTICNRLILNLPQSLVDPMGSASILNILYITIIAFLFTLLIIKLFKNFSNHDIIDVSEYLGGKVFKIIIGFIMCAYLLIVSSIMIRNFCEGLKTLYFSNYSIFFILLFFMLATAICNIFGERTIIKANVFIIPIVIIVTLIALFSCLPRMVPQRIFPILGYGASKTFLEGLTNIFAFNGLFYIFLIMPMLDKKEKFSKIAIISMIATGVLLIISTASLLLAFPCIHEMNQSSPVYFFTRYTHFGRFLQRPEALFVLTWIISLISYVNIAVMFIIKVLKKITNTEQKKYLILPIVTLLFSFALIPRNIVDIEKAQDIFYKYSGSVLTFIIFPLILIFANMKYRKNNPKKSKEEIT